MDMVRAGIYDLAEGPARHSQLFCNLAFLGLIFTNMYVIFSFILKNGPLGRRQ